jgi:GNAT superfamily N-acetyltransferase
VSRLALRPYADADRAAVLAIFDANTPEFFGRGERGWLEDSLDDLDGPAFLAELDGAAVAFGGYEMWDYYDQALLTWGMAHPAVHGRGVGAWLLWARLAMIARETPATSWAVVDTSPQVAPFFLRQGFETGEVRPHAYRAGGTMHVMRFDLSAHAPEALDARAGAAYATALSKLDGAAPSR